MVENFELKLPVVLQSSSREPVEAIIFKLIAVQPQLDDFACDRKLEMEVDSVKDNLCKRREWRAARPAEADSLTCCQSEALTTASACCQTVRRSKLSPACIAFI